MKFKFLASGLAVFYLISAISGRASAQVTAFTYQGLLNSSANTGNATYDLRFTLFADPNLALQIIGGPVTNSAVGVTNGLFLTTLDFGSAAFDGTARWLQIAVRTNAGSAFTVLIPRQQITPTPTAIYASTAAVAAAAGSVSANAVTAAGIQNGVITAAKLASGQVVKSLNGLTDSVNLTAGANVTLTTNGNSLQVAATAGVGSGWLLGGNAGNTSTNYLGTTDNQPVEIRVNKLRGWRLEPTVDTPNIIGNPAVNFASAGLQGVTIAGGGSIATYGSPFPNSVFAIHGTISGGLGNTIQSNAVESTIAGGNQNSIQSSASRSAIGGGILNAIQTNAQNSTIGGGYVNTIQTNASNSTIGGGSGNVIQQASASSSISGGANNVIQPNSGTATIGGGLGNILAGGYSTIAGGQQNIVNGNFATIGGGSANQANFFGCTVGGGFNNVASGPDATIGGGQENTASGTFATIPGGNLNVASGTLSFAAGGDAHATHDHSFVWGDGTQEADSTGPNRFEVLATGGVNFYTGGNNVNIAPPAALAFGGATRQMLNLYGGGYGIGVQNFTLYARSAGGFAWYAGGVHNDNQNNAGGGATLMTLSSSGHLSVPVLTITGGSDVAEPFTMSVAEIPKGSVVSIDSKHPGQLKVCDQPYDSCVAGIVSGANGVNPGLSLQQTGVMEGSQNVALSGRVYVLADASQNAIRPGDLLTTSSTPGHAMKVMNHARSQGAVIGKAMSSLKDGKGMVLVLVTLQ